MNPNVLIIDDETSIHELVKRSVRDRGWQISSAYDGRSGLDLFRGSVVDVVLLDLKLPGIDGLVLLQLLREHDPDAAIFLLTGYADVRTAVEAMQLGAEHFLEKPFEPALLATTVERAVEKVRLRRANRLYGERQVDGFRLAALGDSPALHDVVEQVDRLAATNASILLQGETGTGKGWVAELIHSLSLRPRGAFVHLNCAGASASHLDLELFGQERGGEGRASQRGLLEAAHGGTLFLDEIGELNPEIQPKLLQVLEQGRFRRLGGSKPVEVDVRVIASSRRDLRELVALGRFREDLYYRVAIHPLLLPPLRERGAEAIADLAYRMLEQLRRTLGRGPSRISNEALQRLVSHDWPGNLRELRNVLERAILQSPDAPEMLAMHLPRDLTPEATSAHRPSSDAPRDLATVLAIAERSHMATVLADSRGNRSVAARELGISRATFYEKLKRHQL